MNEFIYIRFLRDYLFLYCYLKILYIGINIDGIGKISF